ncbi:hypothetical protein [Granulicella tundricola]|nr:hypothetical protein [Granulicella tundricola]
MSGHREVLKTLMLQVAALVDRAGGEALTRGGHVKGSHAGACRRRTLDLAQRPELWEGFSEDERGLLLAQEGGWAWETVWPMVVRAEDVRALRWVLGMDRILVPLEYLKPDLRPVVEVTSKPEMAEGTVCLPAWELGQALRLAQAMVSRCVVEGVKRGFLTEMEPEVRAEYVSMAEELGENESEDLLIGSATVGTADTAKVQWVAQAALRRAYVLEGVARYLNGPADGRLRIVAEVVGADEGQGGDERARG